MTIRLISKNRYIGGIRDARFYRIAIIFLYAIIALWLNILINTPPARGYEISIYAAYSPIFWFLFILTIILGIGLTIYFIVRSISLWKYSLPAILIADTVVLFLPTIRNYKFCALGGSDIFAHLGWSKFILNTGQIMDGDHYPAMHIMMATVDQLSLLNPAILAAIISFVFFMLYVLSLFILGRAVFKDDKAAALLATFGSPLLFSFAHYAFYPFLFAIFFFPLLFYIMRKIEGFENKGAYYTCFIILSLFIVFCHPMITLILLLILGVFYGYVQISNRFQLGFSCRFDILNMTAIVGITFVFWYMHFKSILSMGKSVISALLGARDTETIMAYNLDMVSQSGAPLIRVIEGFIKVYGPAVIYIVVALLITTYLVNEFLTKRRYADEMIYVVFFLLSIAFGAALTLGYFIVFEFIRATSFAIIMATIVCGIGFYALLKNTGTPNCKKIFTLVVVIMLCLVSILSVLNVYPSPWTMSAGKHMTKMEISGLDWVLTKQDGSLPLYFNGYTWRTYPIYFQELNKITIEQPQVITESIPHHFGYDQKQHLTQSINDSRDNTFYMATNERLRQNYLAVLEEWRSLKDYYSEEDFTRLNNDSTIMKLYVNSEWEIWRTS